MNLLALMREDVRGMVVNRNQGRVKYFLSGLTKIALYPRIQAVLVFRLSHWCYTHRLTLLAYYFQAWTLSHAGAEIHPAAQIGPGLCLVHSSGIVIGNKARIGAHFICFQGVTVGDSGKGDGMPIIGERVLASAGVKILGGVTIGDYATIGANAVVLADVPPGGVAVGIPARVVKIREISSSIPPADFASADA